MAIHTIERCMDGCRTSLLIAGVVLVNPRRACAARVMVVAVSVYLSVYLCPLSHISLLGLLFVVKTLPSTQQATKVKNVWRFLWNCSVGKIERSLPWLAIHTIGHFSCG